MQISVHVELFINALMDCLIFLVPESAFPIRHNAKAGGLSIILDIRLNWIELIRNIQLKWHAAILILWILEQTCIFDVNPLDAEQTNHLGILIVMVILQYSIERLMAKHFKTMRKLFG